MNELENNESNIVNNIELSYSEENKGYILSVPNKKFAIIIFKLVKIQYLDDIYYLMADYDKETNEVYNLKVCNYADMVRSLIHNNNLVLDHAIRLKLGKIELIYLIKPTKIEDIEVIYGDCDNTKTLEDMKEYFSKVYNIYVYRDSIKRYYDTIVQHRLLKRCMEDYLSDIPAKDILPLMDVEPFRCLALLKQLKDDKLFNHYAFYKVYLGTVLIRSFPEEHRINYGIAKRNIIVEHRLQEDFELYIW